ncbi:MAG: TlpA disulfide reductase family protein, partial [Myxococcota bacterium]|nr:TlpA disulfide reductase family protein [Myxococcota bacterium]
MHAALLATFLSLPAGAATASKDAPAPEVMGLSIDNRPLRLSEFKGEVVVLSFWATWCPPCLEDLDALAREDAALRAEGIRILAVNVDQQHERDAVGAL